MYYELRESPSYRCQVFSTVYRCLLCAHLFCYFNFNKSNVQNLLLYVAVAFSSNVYSLVYFFHVYIFIYKL